jgi:hypothetical protein
LKLKFEIVENLKSKVQKLLKVCLALTIGSLLNPACGQTLISKGEQPQITIDAKRVIRVVFGETEQIFYSTSTDNGKTFSDPALIGEVKEMHLGMTRGPQLATSKDYSIVTAMDKNGNIHCFELNHRSNKWRKVKNVTDVDHPAPEGLMSIASDDNNNFYAVWLDLREDRKNNICFSSMNPAEGWSKNKFIYKSPESNVCECCKPSIVAKGNTISVMFRNWLKGSRDLFLTTSTNQGKTFSEAQKLGSGTWPLNGCPMDGGGLLIDDANRTHTFWQRQGEVYYARPGSEETKIGEGRGCGIGGNQNVFLTWEKDGLLKISALNGKQMTIGEGTALRLVELANNNILAIWEKDKQIYYNSVSSF